MNILLYNWAGIDGNSGGGVNVYIKNLIRGLLDRGHDISFLNSGVKYTRDNKLRIEKLSEYFGGCKRYEIVNSPVLAPAHSMFDDLDTVVKNHELQCLFFNFCESNNFDIIHFNNIEGLSLDILSLRNKLRSKFIYSVHNYNIVCPQVNLWKNEKENCIEYNKFKNCAHCVYPNNIKKEREKRICTSDNMSIRILRSFYRNIIKKKIFKINKKNEFEHFKPCREVYRDFIAESINQINKNIDLLISVSQKTHDVVCKRGIRTDRHRVVYIGTEFAQKAKQMIKIKEYQDNDTILSIAYLGYMRHDKGYFYLMYLLENMPEVLSKRINFIVAARCNNNEEMQRLKRLENNVNSIIYYNGYSHNNISTILKDVDLGIIPVLWEDCLPQVAIEFVSHGVPILTSDLGGAKEIGNNDLFIYKANDPLEFQEKIAYLLYNKKKLNEFWKNFNPPKTIDQHIDEIETLYHDVIYIKKKVLIS